VVYCDYQSVAELCNCPVIMVQLMHMVHMSCVVSRVLKVHICHGTHHRTQLAQSLSTPSTWRCVMRQAQWQLVHQAPDQLSWRLSVSTVDLILSVWCRMLVCCKHMLTTPPSLLSSSALLLATRRDMDLRRKSDGCRVIAHISNSCV